MRISFRAVRRAHQISPLLPPLLRVGLLQQAQRELQWIQQELPRKEWKRAVLRRLRLEPLQYILGTQPFGPLTIQCRPGVLIPRWETEEYTCRIAQALKGHKLAVVDACTGLGCIPLLLKHECPQLDVSGFDVSPVAVRLAEENAIKNGVDVKFYEADVFSTEIRADFITSNPPYVPDADMRAPVTHNGLERSVRQYEPDLALRGHLEFYERLVQLVRSAQAQGFFFELGYSDQAALVEAALPDWTVKRYVDSAGRLRAVVGWRALTCLEEVLM